MALHDPEEDARRKAGGGSTPAEGLTPDSTEQEVRAALEATVSMLVEQGFSQEQAAQVAIAQAKKATGRDTEGRSRVRRAS